MSGRFFTFWGKLVRNTLVTSEGSLHYVVYEDSVLQNVYSFFLVEKRGRSWLVLRQLSETKPLPRK